MKSTARSKSFSAAGASALLSIVLAILLSALAHGETSAVQRTRAIAQWNPARSIDKSKLVRRGLRVLEGRHITLVTDLEASPEVDALPRAVDAAVPLLAERFGVRQAKIKDWRVLGMVIGDRAKFAAAGLMPEGEEEFRDGLSIGYELWIVDQPSDYYRRHLLLHELTHSFMATQLGGCGPGWYMEGVAELLGTHSWEAPNLGGVSVARKELKLAVMPMSREAVVMWGRTKLVNQAVADGRLLPIPTVMKIDNREALGVESYAWAWALAKFLDTHPQYQHRFRKLQEHTLDPEFDQRFRKMFKSDWWELTSEWRLFAQKLEYGHDIAREAIDWPRAGTAKPLEASLRTKVLAERGWQPAGVLLERGERYELKASGRYVIGAEPDGTPWPCEPGGITLRYYNKRPIGKLIAAVVDRSGRAGNGLVEPVSVGLGAVIEPERSGELFLRMSDAPSELAQNRGSAMVSVRRLP